MKIENFKKGNVVNHSLYGEGTIEEIFLDDKDSRNEGVLISLESKRGIDQLNKDRQIKNMPVREKDRLTKVFESNTDRILLI